MNPADAIKIVDAISEKRYDDARILFEEYTAAINFDAGFKNISDELARLETRYNQPNGRLLLAYQKDKAVGCIAVLKMQHGVAELKRFYVQPDFRQFKIGAQLLQSAVINARNLHFEYLRLELIPTLTKAKQLYESFGFYPIEPYQHLALEGTACMELKLVDL